MPRWLTKVLERIHALALRRRLRFTGKATREIGSLGLDLEDVQGALLRLRSANLKGRQVSNLTGEWMYVFKLRVDADLLYVKLLLRSECVIIVSFHEDDGGLHEEDE